jgi:phosphate transport system permease protein/phosphate transport system substrate-binding protein
MLLVPYIGTHAFAQITPPSQMGGSQQQQGQVTLNGAGATFPFPLIDTWRVDYQKVNPNVNINYQSIGSGGGIKQFTQKTVDFGASDAPLTAAQRSALSAPAVHIPETIGSVVVAYNVVGIPDKGLKLTGSVLANIFLGKITKWNDPQIKALNPGLSLPSNDIVVVHRSDGSGTTFVWTDYLSKVSSDWQSQVGKGTAVSWPVGIGAPGNEGVANSIKSNANTIGYVELAYALTNKMQYAFLQNQAGNFIEPSINSTRAAVSASAASLPKGEDSWENVSMTNAPGANSYPIASFSYLLLYKELSNDPQINTLEKAKDLIDFINWAITDGQQSAADLNYVPLPDSVVQLDKGTLALITYKGTPLISEMQQQPQPSSYSSISDQKSFTVSTTINGTMYTLAGKSATAKATNVTIIPKQSLTVTFDGSGQVELTLPKAVIDGIMEVKAGNHQISYQKINDTSSSDSTTIQFTLPSNSDSVQIAGTTVVPEFSVIGVLIFATSLAIILGYSRFATFNKQDQQCY